MLFHPIHPALPTALPFGGTGLRARLRRVASDFTGSTGRLGTADRRIVRPECRTAPGWLSVRIPEFFLAGRKNVLGTAPLSLIKSMVRAAPGWLPARPSKFSRQPASPRLGTAGGGVASMESRTAPGWLSVRVPMNFTTAGAGDYHLPVLPDEVAHWMAAEPDRFIIDGTLGGGGHSEGFLRDGASVLGVDRDPEALAHARSRLASFGARFTTWEGNFSQVREIPALHDGPLADGLLLDLGVSSRQLDSAARGFSFMREGPLDMRMGPSSPRSAAEVVNDWPEADLVRILFEFGEEPKARRIASAIVARRAVRLFETTTDLAACIEQSVGRHSRTHPATRAFQAIRMAVNEELESLAAALAASPHVLKPGGRLLVITFHSLEDRLVKRFLRHRSSPFIDDPSWPAPRPNPDLAFQLLSRKAITAGPAETARNPRARSAKLRVAQLLPCTP
jgi:16S rRNA (cytosine1402-N4)-methyltransferase